MSGGQRWFARIAVTAAGGSGLVFAVMRHLLEPADEWAVVNHPWQPHVQHLHVLAGPLLVFAVAAMWREHAVEKRNAGRRGGRFSGIGLLALFWPMVATGYLAQVAVAPAWRSFWQFAHLGAALLWLAAALAHGIVAWARRRARARGVNSGGFVSSHECRAAGPIIQRPAHDAHGPTARHFNEDRS